MKEEYTWTEKGTLYSNVYDDVFFHDGDGLDETDYVFLQGNKLRERLPKEDLKVGELGFGTGLNYLLTWKLWQETGRKKGKRLTFISCEKHPLSLDILEKSHSQFPQLKEFSSQLRAKWPPVKTGFHLLEFEEGRVALLLLFGDCFESLKKFEGKVDAWFLDGFSPAKNKDMWSEDVFKQMTWHSHENTTLATFTAAGFVRRGLQEVGFEIERIKGFGYKKHMTVGSYKGYVKDRLHLAPWFRSPDLLKPCSVAVIGAGMAGLNMAYYLERAGYSVTVFDSESEIAEKASGNKRGMMYPLISKKPDRLGAFTEAGAHFSYSQIKELGLEHREGLLEFISSDKKALRFGEALSRYSTDYVEMVDTEYSKKAVLHKRGLSISPLEYCRSLSEKLRGSIRLNKKLNSLSKSKDGWLLNFADGSLEEFAAVFMAGAYESGSVEQLTHLQMRVSRGQISYIDKKFVSSAKKDLNFINYLTEADDCYILGATFDVDDLDSNCRVNDTQSLLDSIHKYFPGVVSEEIEAEKLAGKVCFRTVIKDYFPIVGGCPDEKDYKTLYGSLKHGKPVSRYDEGEYHKNLFVSCGHGSRGLTFSPLSAAYLSRLLRDGIH
ncbi:MAG: bifunctional tRNA (5-methylaminomethyl-2-thiouridine)(34)-methyltransferase MnmD/FAD-dependent 5-carboxymethylaminomethyl-2-thiouridine(34) oxidoreductase MnmC, partial [Lentisphaeraceae bacterium]|nr:bifunctional tRNA (5-methylaminomethyl-2-thiouridine)(34)-methyltransferase MnmD/FAD-dependent 5-carboxymethylaminomethyl-2-thiouridine(34) oxidoreductase MnmC [Lentisphaeraceae bacterium]